MSLHNVPPSETEESPDAKVIPIQRGNRGNTQVNITLDARTFLEKIEPKLPSEAKTSSTDRELPNGSDVFMFFLEQIGAVPTEDDIAKQQNVVAQLRFVQHEATVIPTLKQSLVSTKTRIEKLEHALIALDLHTVDVSDSDIDAAQHALDVLRAEREAEEKRLEDLQKKYDDIFYPGGTTRFDSFAGTELFEQTDGIVEDDALLRFAEQARVIGREKSARAANAGRNFERFARFMIFDQQVRPLQKTEMTNNEVDESE